MNTTINTDSQQQIHLKIAQNIGAHLAKEAIWYKDRCNWVGSEVVPFGGHFQTVKRSFGNEVYSGLAGIALFLARLNARQPDDVIGHTLDGALNNILTTFDENLPGFGFYSGKLGIYYTLEKIGQLLNRDELITFGLQGIYQLMDVPLQDFEIDVVSGAAGVIPALLQLYQQYNDERLLQLAKKCGDFLLDKARKDTTNNCVYWTTIETQQGLTGFSHGAAGIALALLELYMATQETKYWESALGGFNYERRWFNPQQGNWPDLRNYDHNKPNEIVCGHAWCHGAPGIALSRLRAYELVNAQEYYFKQEAEIALDTTYQQIKQELANTATRNNYSLCHGLAGNAYSLLLGGLQLNKPHYVQLAQQVGLAGIKMYDQTNTAWPSGVNDPSGKTVGQEETPGLMLGLAGTGMFYMSLANIEDMDNVLITGPKVQEIISIESNF